MRAFSFFKHSAFLPDSRNKLNTRILSLLLLLISVLFLNSCCHKKDCEESIELKNFNDEDTDSIIGKSYQKNSNFLILSDSFFTSAVHPSWAAEKLLVNFPRGFSYELEYKIDVISIGKNYSITGFEIKKEECNSCFPWGH